jgi:hypothetical protein
MDAQAIKNLGGALQIIGVVIVVWDLLNLHQYLGDLTRLKAWLQTPRVRVEGWLRRLLRRPGRSVVVHAHPASMAMLADLVTARLTPDPFVAPPDQSPAEQLAAQAEYLNRLRDWMVEELKLRDQVTDAERERVRAELVAERGRLDRVIAEADRELKELRKLTTSGIGSRWFGVPVLLAGIAFSTWPDGWAEVWPTWLSPLVLGFLLACAVAAWICWAILTQLRAEDPTTSP